jgi:hypothetical protein
MVDSACLVVSIYECAYLLYGLSYSIGAECSPGACPATGACCLNSMYSTCRIQSEFGCAEVERGTYQGDGTTCEETCGRPQACCFRDVHCVDAYEDDCWRDRGRPAGRGTECGTHQCLERGDIDADMDRDLQDYQSILSCFSGPGNYAECFEQDLDEDKDVDLYDITILQIVFTGG